MRRHRREKEKQRYYLLPGQGGKMYRQKQKFILKWSVIAALAMALVLAAVMYLLNRPHSFMNP